MKKLKLVMISLISMFVFGINVYAASGSLSVSSGSVYVGSSFTATVNINSAAAWNIHVSATGPVSGCVINQADATSDAMDTNKSFSATCTATGEGTITISLTGDVTSANDGVPVNVSGSRSVVVSKKPATPAPTPSNNNNPSPKPTVTDNRSTNNNLKKLSIEGYELNKVDNKNYTLSVSNNVTSINVDATAEDSKAKITGAGKHNLEVGENNIEIIVTAENGFQNKINIKVTRKDSYYLEDLDSVLKDDKIEDIGLTIKNDTTISQNEIEKIKDNKKVVSFNYYDENKKMLYSWSIDGSKIKDSLGFITTVEFEEADTNIYELSNYADGKYIDFKHSGKLPEGTKIKLYVGDKFKDGSEVNIYYYNENEKSLEIIKESLKVESGYVEFELEHCSKYFATMSRVENVDTISNVAKDKFNIYVLTTIIEFIIIIILIFLYINKSKKKLSSEKLINEIASNNNIDTTSDMNESIDDTNLNDDAQFNTKIDENLLNDEFGNKKLEENDDIQNDNFDSNNYS